jgi:hypothetical protein
MADNTPNALDAQSPAPPPAAAPEPAPAAPVPSGGLWATLSGKQKLLVVAGGSVVAAVGAMYGAKQFSPTPGRAVAQTPVVSPADPVKDPDPDKKPAKEKADETDVLPPVGVPAVRPAKAEEKPAVPDVDKFKVPEVPELPTPPRELPTDLKTDKKKPDADVPELALPPVPVKAPPAKPDLGLPDLAPPPVPGVRKDPAADKPPAAEPTIRIPSPTEKPPAPGPKPTEDPFKSVDDLPPIPGTPKGRTTGPITPVSGTETPPAPEKKAGDPAGLKVDLDLPPPPKPAGGVADTPKLDLDVPPPPPLPGKKSAPAAAPPLPPLGDPAGSGVPPLPATPKLPEVKLPEVKTPETRLPADPPTIEVGPAPVPMPKIEVRPAPSAPEPGPAALPPVGAAPAEPAKKDSYEEDWHTPDGGVNTYVGISNFYYKTPDYAEALKAYNRERQKPGETIVRVPPTWVLDEKFPTLTKKGATPGGLTFDKVEPAGGARPAPAPVAAAGGSDEYRVTAEAGEKIKDIARKLYGDPNAWRKLTDLNPNLDPTEPIPAGTTLRVGK